MGAGETGLSGLPRRTCWQCEVNWWTKPPWSISVKASHPPPVRPWDEAEVSPPEWSRLQTGRCRRENSWRSSGWRRLPRRKESCTSPALRSAPSGCSPRAGSRRTDSKRRQRRRQPRSGRRLSRQRPTWKSNRSKSYWGLPTRKTAWREPWTDMVICGFTFFFWMYAINVKLLSVKVSESWVSPTSENIV